MNGKRRSEHGRGFTLTELLVVISIVVLLMAMLFPSFSRARRQAQAVVCQSNVRQWAVITSMHATEHSVRLLGHRFLFDVDGDSYRNREKLYLCPAAKTAHAIEDTIDRPVSGIGGTSAAWWAYVQLPGSSELTLVRGSYGYNWHAVDFTEGQFSKALSASEKEALQALAAQHWNQMKISHPGDVPILFDCASHVVAPLEADEPPAYVGDVTTTPVAWPSPTYGNNTMKYVCIDRHRNGATIVAFADGSARKVGLKQLWTLKWHRLYNTSGPWTKAGGVLPDDWPQWMWKFEDY